MRGGQREGAGRPKGVKNSRPRVGRPKRKISLAISADIADRLQERAALKGTSQSAIVDALLGAAL